MIVRAMMCILALAALALGSALAWSHLDDRRFASLHGGDVNDVAQAETYLSDLHEQLCEVWPDNRTINIVFHGHSVPAGYGRIPEINTFEAYPHLFHVGLKKRYPNAMIQVIVTAKSGEDAVDGARRFERDVLSQEPDLVVIDYGLNDRWVKFQDARRSWMLMIEKAQANGVPVVLLTPTADQRVDLFNPNDALNKQAEMIRQLAAEYGVGLVDSYKAFQDYARTDGQELPDLMAQENHPNLQGHSLVAEELLAWFPEDIKTAAQK